MAAGALRDGVAKRKHAWQQATEEGKGGIGGGGRTAVCLVSTGFGEMRSMWRSVAANAFNEAGRCGGRRLLLGLRCSRCFCTHHRSAWLTLRCCLLLSVQATCDNTAPAACYVSTMGSDAVDGAHASSPLKTIQVPGIFALLFTPLGMME